MKNVRHSSRCQNLPGGQTRVGHTWDQTPVAPWTDPTIPKITQERKSLNVSSCKIVLNQPASHLPFARHRASESLGRDRHGRRGTAGSSGRPAEGNQTPPCKRHKHAPNTWFYLKKNKTNKHINHTVNGLNWFNKWLTFLFEGEIFRQMPAFVVAPQQVQGGRIANFQRPQVEDALNTHTECNKKWTNESINSCQTFHLANRENKNCYLYAEISSIDVITEEEILGIGRRSAHFKQFHQIVKLSVNVATNWNVPVQYTENTLITINGRWPAAVAENNNNKNGTDTEYDPSQSINVLYQRHCTV